MAYEDGGDELDDACETFVLRVFRDLPRGNGVMSRMRMARAELLRRINIFAGPDDPTKRETP